MLGLLMRYYLYCTDNNHDIDVDLMFLNVFRFDCAHLNYTDDKSQGALAGKIKLGLTIWHVVYHFEALHL